jgi:hypothetical protein
VQLELRDCENFSYLSNWGPYLLLGTTEGEIIVMEPNQWMPVNTMKAPFKLKSAVNYLKANS